MTSTNLDQFEDQLWDDLRDREYGRAANSLRELSTQEVGRVLDRTPPSLMPVAFRLLDKDVAVDVFATMEPSLQSDLVDGLQDEQVQEIFGQLQSGPQVRLIDEVPAEVAQRLLSGLTIQQRSAAGQVLGYPEDSVGRWADGINLQLSPEMTAGRALELVKTRKMSDADARNLSVLPVGSTTHKVLGLVDLPMLVRADQHTPVAELMYETPTVQAHDDAEDAARIAVHDRLLALPVVDEAGRMVGMLHMDDAQQILEEEEAEDTYRSVGSAPLGQPYLSTSIMRLVKSRVVWLLVLAVGATLTVQVLNFFEDTLATMVVLTLFIPLLTGTGGNTGNQAATIVTRALALNEVQPKDVWRVIGREALVGATLGTILGVLGFVIAGALFGWNVGLVIGLTLLAICTVAASVGSLMPLIASKIGVDPAVFSNPFISTVVDALGLIVYFLVARSVLGI